MRHLIAVLCAVCVASCAVGPKFTEVTPPNGGLATIYIYREARWAASVQGAHFAINGTPVFGLSSGGYSYVFAKPGHYVVSETWDVDPRAVQDAVDVRAGETYFFRFRILWGQRPGMIEFNWSLVPVSPDVARREIADESFQAPTFTGILESNLPPGPAHAVYPLPSDGNQRPAPAAPSRPSGKQLP